MRIAVLGYLFREKDNTKEVLLAMKKRDFGKGNYSVLGSPKSSGHVCLRSGGENPTLIDVSTIGSDPLNLRDLAPTETPMKRYRAIKSTRP